MEFIFRLQPFEDENLVSYLYRHSAANCYPVDWIFSHLYFRIPEKRHNIINLSSSDIKRISYVFNLKSNEVNNMIYSKYNIDGNLQLLNLRGTRYCPMCLKEKGYYRLYWDIKPLNICIKHNLFLLDKCLNCGNEVSMLDIINSKCICGKDLLESNFNVCQDESILNQQFDLLQKMGISISNGYTISNGEYNQSFFYSFHKLIHFIKTKRYRLKKIGMIFREYAHFDDDFYISIILYKIKDNLELYLPILLDDLNQIYLDLDGTEDYYVAKGNSISNPLSEIANYILDFDNYFEKHDCFYNCLNNYFIDNYNCQFFSDKLQRYMEDENIELSTASNFFNIDKNTLLDSIKTHKYKKYIFAELKDVIEIVYSFIARYKIYEINYEDYISFPEVSQLFKNFGLEEIDILKVIDDKEIEGALNVFNNNIGMNLLVYKKENLIPILLQESLNRYY